MQEHFPSHASQGAKNAIRPPEGLHRPMQMHGQMQSSSAREKLPKLQEPQCPRRGGGGSMRLDWEALGGRLRESRLEACQGDRLGAAQNQGHGSPEMLEQLSEP